jgi:hypothetical protein
VIQRVAFLLFDSLSRDFKVEDAVVNRPKQIEHYWHKYHRPNVLAPCIFYIQIHEPLLLGWEMGLLVDRVPLDVVHGGHGHEVDSKGRHHVYLMKDQAIAEEID